MPTTVSQQTPSELVIRLFGPMEVYLGDTPLPRLRSQKGEWLLALLVLHHPSGVRRDWLAGTLWPESEESLALFYLRRELSQLRKALGSEATRLVVGESHLLRFDLSGACCDLLAFDRAIIQEDTPSLEEAASLYRGPLLQ